MIEQETKEIINYINYIERKAKEELIELKAFHKEKLEILMNYIEKCYASCFDDGDFDDWIEDEFPDRSRGHFTPDLLECTQEELDRFNNMFQEYKKEVKKTLKDVDTFQEAVDCQYLMDHYIDHCDREYKIFIQEGAELERIIEEVKTFANKI